MSGAINCPTRKKSCWMLFKTCSPENAPCNAITEDRNADVETSSANENDQLLDPEGDLPNEEPSPEALEVGRGTHYGQDYHKNYNQPSSSYVNPSRKQVVNAPSGNNNENEGPREAFMYDLIVLELGGPRG